MLSFIQIVGKNNASYLHLALGFIAMSVNYTSGLD